METKKDIEPTLNEVLDLIDKNNTYHFEENNEDGIFITNYLFKRKGMMFNCRKVLRKRKRQKTLFSKIKNRISITWYSYPLNKIPD